MVIWAFYSFGVTKYEGGGESMNVSIIYIYHIVISDQINQMIQSTMQFTVPSCKAKNSFNDFNTWWFFLVYCMQCISILCTQLIVRQNKQVHVKEWQSYWVVECVDEVLLTILLVRYTATDIADVVQWVCSHTKWQITTLYWKWYTLACIVWTL